MWEGIMAGAALAVSIITFVVTQRRTAQLERMRAYLDLERESDAHIYALLIQHDFLNTLFFETPRIPPPSLETSSEDLTPEHRALLNFAEMLLDYFEQIVLLQRSGLMPKGVPQTWDPWMRSCTKAPYFRWAWLRVREGYHPDLQRVLEVDAPAPG
jgi:hypothetical protein